MTKLALINPGNNPEYSITEPLNLGFLASYAIRKIPDLDIIIIDELAGDDVFTKISEFHPDFIGITGVTPLINRTYELARFFGDQGYTIILGGPHASALPEEAQKYATYVIVGEGEEALVNIIKGKESEGIVTGSPINTLDDIPPPARHLLHMDYYMRSRDRNSSSFLNFIPLHSHVASIISSRGCPFNCCFCHNSFKDLPYRYHSPERIVQEIKELINNFNVNAIFLLKITSFLISYEQKEYVN